FSAKEISKRTPKSANNGGVFFQPKLTVNQPNDRYEQEADAMADRVMRTKAPSNVVQRKCQHCEEEEKRIHRKEADHFTPAIDTEFESYVSSLDRHGAALPQAERDFFEPRFGYDFS